MSVRVGYRLTEVGGIFLGMCTRVDTGMGDGGTSLRPQVHIDPI